MYLSESKSILVYNNRRQVRRERESFLFWLHLLVKSERKSYVYLFLNLVDHEFVWMGHIVEMWKIHVNLIMYNLWILYTIQINSLTQHTHTLSSVNVCIYIYLMSLIWQPLFQNSLTAILFFYNCLNYIIFILNNGVFFSRVRQNRTQALILGRRPKIKEFGLHHKIGFIALFSRHCFQI